MLYPESEQLGARTLDVSRFFRGFRNMLYRSLVLLKRYGVPTAYVG